MIQKSLETPHQVMSAAVVLATPLNSFTFRFLELGVTDHSRKEEKKAGGLGDMDINSLGFTLSDFLLTPPSHSLSSGVPVPNTEFSFSPDDFVLTANHKSPVGDSSNHQMDTPSLPTQRRLSQRVRFASPVAHMARRGTPNSPALQVDLTASDSQDFEPPEDDMMIVDPPSKTSSDTKGKSARALLLQRIALTHRTIPQTGIPEPSQEGVLNLDTISDLPLLQARSQLLDQKELLLKRLEQLRETRDLQRKLVENAADLILRVHDEILHG